MEQPPITPALSGSASALQAGFSEGEPTLETKRTMRLLAVRDDARRRLAHDRMGVRWSAAASVVLASLMIATLTRAVAGSEVVALHIVAHVLLTASFLISALRMMHRALRFADGARLERELLDDDDAGLARYLVHHASIAGVSDRFDALVARVRQDLLSQKARAVSMGLLSVGLFALFLPLSVTMAVFLGVVVLIQGIAAGYVIKTTKTRLADFTDAAVSDNPIGFARAVVDQDYGLFDSFVRIEVSRALASEEDASHTGVSETAEIPETDLFAGDQEHSEGAVREATPRTVYTAEAFADLAARAAHSPKAIDVEDPPEYKIPIYPTPGAPSAAGVQSALSPVLPAGEVTPHPVDAVEGFIPAPLSVDSASAEDVSASVAVIPAVGQQPQESQAPPSVSGPPSSQRVTRFEGRDRPLRL